MRIFFLAAITFCSLSSYSQVASTLSQTPDSTKKLMIVDATCGECNLGMPGDDCDLAVSINGNHYYVDGVSITEFGHPHNKGGFCVAVRKAEVQGEVVNGRFKASYFKLLDDKNKKQKN